MAGISPKNGHNLGDSMWTSSPSHSKHEELDGVTKYCADSVLFAWFAASAYGDK